MSGRLTKNDLLALHNPSLLLAQQKAGAKNGRAAHRYSHQLNFETHVNNIYDNIINNARNGEVSTSIPIVEEGGSTPEMADIYINEVKCNSCIDISGNYIIDVLSNPILAVTNNNLYDISGGELGNLIISNMNIQGELDISGNNTVVDDVGNVLFKVSGDNVLGTDDSILATIVEATLSNKVLSTILSKFEDISGEIQTPVMLFSEGDSPPPNKSMIFSWNV